MSDSEAAWIGPEYRHAFCGCLRARGQLADANRWALENIEGATRSRLQLSGATQLEAVMPEGAAATCPHELNDDDVAPWARLSSVWNIQLRADTLCGVNSRNLRSLRRAQVLPTSLRPGIGIGFRLHGVRSVIQAKFGVSLDELWSDEIDLDDTGEAIVTSWEVLLPLGTAIQKQVFQLLAEQKDPYLPAARSARLLVENLIRSTGRGHAECGSLTNSLVCFAYGSAALLALGADRRLLAYWAHALSLTTPMLKSFCIDVVDRFLTAMLYRNQLEVELTLHSMIDPSPAASFTTHAQNSLTVAQMGERLLDNLLL